MKDRLPKGWGWKKLGDKDVSRLIMGQSPDSATYNLDKNGLPFYQGKKDFGIKYPIPTVYCYKPVKIVENGDILMSVRAPVGPTNVCKETSCIGRGLAGIRANERNIIKEYLLFYFKNFELEINRKGKGSTFQAITKNDLENLEVPIPPMDEQKKIVIFLDKIFNKLDQSIALIQENISNLKKLNESLLDEIFDKKSEEWEKFKLFEKIKLYNGKAYNRDELLNAGKYKIIRIQNLNGGSNWYYSNLELDKEKYCSYGDLLYSWSGTPGTSFGAFKWKGEKSIYHYHIWKIELREEVDKNFIFYLLKYVTHMAIKQSHGVTGMMHISKAKMENLEIRVPSIITQQYIVSYLDRVFIKNNLLIQHFQSKLKDLEELKKSILNSTFKGELKKEVTLPMVHSKMDTYLQRVNQLNSKKNADKQAMVIALAIEQHESLGKSLYRTRGEKIVELVEKHINLEFGREAIKMAAGPASFTHLVKIVEPLAKERKWFNVQEVRGEKYDSHKYIKAENFNPFLMRCVIDLKTNLDEIRRMINLFANMKTTHEVEVIATTYTGWNNLIIRKAKIDEEVIVTEARENWHEAKLKIERSEFFDAIKWLINNNLIPKGNGKEVN